MADEEMEASDVSGLSRRQLDAVNTRLIRYSTNEDPVLQEENKAVIEAEVDSWIESVRN
jgi:hypothetical protein